MRRKVTFGDFVRGAVASIRDGNGMNPLQTQRYVNRAHDVRTFGDGESHDNRTFDAPVHATTEDGRPITIAFGKPGTSRANQILIADGHLSAEVFYKNGRSRDKGHDHLTSDGVFIADRGRSS